MTKEASLLYQRGLVSLYKTTFRFRVHPTGLQSQAGRQAGAFAVALAALPLVLALAAAPFAEALSVAHPGHEP